MPPDPFAAVGLRCSDAEIQKAYHHLTQPLLYIYIPVIQQCCSLVDIILKFLQEQTQWNLTYKKDWVFKLPTCYTECDKTTSLFLQLKTTDLVHTKYI